MKKYQVVLSSDKEFTVTIEAKSIEHLLYILDHYYYCEYDIVDYKEIK